VLLIVLFLAITRMDVLRLLPRVSGWFRKDAETETVQTTNAVTAAGEEAGEGEGGDGH
jgi:hypothetical protein